MVSPRLHCLPPWKQFALPRGRTPRRSLRCAESQGEMKGTGEKRVAPEGRGHTQRACSLRRPWSLTEGWSVTLPKAGDRRTGEWTVPFSGLSEGWEWLMFPPAREERPRGPQRGR